MATRINRYLDSVSAYDNLEIDLIRSPANVLRHDSSPDLSELIDSIRENGLLQPIVVRPHGEKFEVVAGCRRLEACRRLKHRKIKAMVVELDDKTAYEISIAENVQRKTLEPLEEAVAFKKYCDEFGWGSQSELARKIGKSQEFVSHRIKLLELPEEVRIALSRKEITLSSAEELVWLKNDDAKKRATQYLKSGMSIHGVRDVIRAINSPVLKSGEADRKKQEVPELESSNQGSDRERDFSKTITESILILRIALIRLDDLIAKTKDPLIKHTIVSKRIALHGLIDELIATKRHSVEAPELIVRRPN